MTLRKTELPWPALACTSTGIELISSDPGVERIVADFNRDGDVDGNDLVSFAGYYQAGFLEADLNEDNVIDETDVATFAANFGKTD